MKSHFKDTDSQSWELPETFREEDIRLSEDILERYIDRYTDEGDLVFDPFAGFGTSLVIAEKMGRKTLGYEILKDRAAYAGTLLSDPSSIVQGDIALVDSSNLPEIDLCISSPPYMNRDDQEDPLSAYQAPVASYTEYVNRLAGIYTSIGSRLKPTGHLVIQLQNLRNQQGVTPLAWDVHQAMGQDLQFVGEEICTWDHECYGYSHGYCLCYSAR